MITSRPSSSVSSPYNFQISYHCFSSGLSVNTWHFDNYGPQYFPWHFMTVKTKCRSKFLHFHQTFFRRSLCENRRYFQRITSISNRFTCCTSTATLIDFWEIMIWAILESVTYPHQIIHMTLIPADSFLPILSNFRNITVKDSTKLGKFCLEHGGHQEKTTGTKKQQVQENNR